MLSGHPAQVFKVIFSIFVCHIHYFQGYFYILIKFKFFKVAYVNPNDSFRLNAERPKSFQLSLQMVAIADFIGKNPLRRLVQMLGHRGFNPGYLVAINGSWSVLWTTLKFPCCTGSCPIKLGYPGHVSNHLAQNFTLVIKSINNNTDSF